MTQIFLCSFFFFNDTATTEIYTLSLHDALPISHTENLFMATNLDIDCLRFRSRSEEHTSELQSHSFISYAVFCLKKKNTKYHYARLSHVQARSIPRGTDQAR